MASADGRESNGTADATQFFCAPSLDAADVTRWRAFADGVPWAHFRQDTAWAEIERAAGGDARRPYFFWAEREGALRLTAIGVRRRLPVPGRVFWEFDKGPTIDDVDALDQWLPWLLARLGREAARVRVAPPIPLDRGGDDAETVLERHGFARHRMLGGWATLVADLTGDEDAIMRAIRPATQRAIRKSLRAHIEVRAEDDPVGWKAVSELQDEVARLSPAEPASPSQLERLSRLWLRGGTGGTVLVARRQGEPLAAALVVVYQGTAHLPMIPSSRRHRELPASHLLVWEAMRWAKGNGCSALDLSGYSLVARPGEALWGINQFKRGFVGLEGLLTSAAVHERVRSPLLAASARVVRDAQARWRRGEKARES